MATLDDIWIKLYQATGIKFSMTPRQIGQLVKELRNSRKMTQAELAEAAKVSTETVKRWEAGRGEVLPKYWGDIAAVLEPQGGKLTNLIEEFRPYYRSSFTTAGPDPVQTLYDTPTKEEVATVEPDQDDGGPYDDMPPSEVDALITSLLPKDDDLP